jgi:hypothetical protein
MPLRKEGQGSHHRWTPAPTWKIPAGEAPPAVIPITRPGALLTHVYTISGGFAAFYRHP